MSAKGRREGGSAPYDYYPTPQWCVDALLNAEGDRLMSGVYSVLEPTVGDGAIVRAVQGLGCLQWTGVELRRGALRADTRELLATHVEGVDFRRWQPSRAPYDLAIGNPPYAIAESIIRHALSMSRRAAFLLRVGFLGSAERVPFWRDFPDIALRVLPDRPSFDDAGVDAATYAWFVWDCPGITGVRVLEPTPASVRGAQKPGAVVVDPRQTALFAEAE